MVVTKGDGGSAGADNKLTTDGVIYPKYAAFAEAQTGNSPTQLWGLEIDHTGSACVARLSARPPACRTVTGVWELVFWRCDWCFFGRGCF